LLAALSLKMAHMNILAIIIIIFSVSAMAKDVEVYDLDSNSVTLVPQEELGPEFVRISLEGEIYWADSNKLNQNEHQHPPFTGKRKEKVEFIQKSLAEVNGQSYLEWEDGFRRDANPDNEIAIWGHIIQVYKRHSVDAASQSEKHEIYQVVLVCSYSEPSVVLSQLNLVVLSKDRAGEIVDDYYK